MAYGNEVRSGKIATLEGFATQCACAWFQECSTLPDRVEVDRHWYEAVEHSRERLALLELMDQEERIRYGEEFIALEAQRIQDHNRKAAEGNQRVLDMLTKIRVWRNSADVCFGNLAEFMTKDLIGALHDIVAEPVRGDPTELVERALRSAQDSLRHCLAALDEEISRVETTNKWIGDLRESVRGL